MADFACHEHRVALMLGDFTAAEDALAQRSRPPIRSPTRAITPLTSSTSPTYLRSAARSTKAPASACRRPSCRAILTPGASARRAHRRATARPVPRWSRRRSLPGVGLMRHPVNEMLTNATARPVTDQRGERWLPHELPANPIFRDAHRDGPSRREENQLF